MSFSKVVLLQPGLGVMARSSPKTCSAPGWWVTWDFGDFAVTSREQSLQCCACFQRASACRALLSHSSAMGVMDVDEFMGAQKWFPEVANSFTGSFWWQHPAQDTPGTLQDLQYLILLAILKSIIFFFFFPGTYEEDVEKNLCLHWAMSKKMNQLRGSSDPC